MAHLATSSPDSGPDASRRGMLFARHLGAMLLCLLLCICNAATASDVSAIKSVNIKPYQEAIDGFKEVVPAKVKEYVVRYKGADGADREKLLLIIKGKKSDLVFTVGSDALDLVKNEFNDIPILFSFVLNPDQVIGDDWLKSKPNIRGISMNIPPAEQFGVLKKLHPKAKRIGVVYDPTKSQELVNDAARSANELGLTLVRKEIKSTSEAINAIDGMKGEADAVWMIPDTTAITRESMKYMLLFSYRNNLPLIGISEKYVKSGALFALSFDSGDIGRQAGEIAEKLLDGSTPSEEGLYAPRRLRLSINTKTAEKIGLDLPRDIVKFADKLY